MSLEEIIGKHLLDIEEFLIDGEMSDSLYDDLYRYYCLNGEMPYGTAKGRTGDPMYWVADKLYSYLEENKLIK